MLEIIIGCSIVLVIAAFLIFRKKMKKTVVSESDEAGLRRRPSLKDVALPKVDPREQKIEDSAEKLRQILSTLADVVGNVNDAADSSSNVLGEAKIKISNIKASQYVEEASLLIDEIDRVISSNNTLKTELVKSRDELKAQQEKIENLQTAVRIDALTELANRASLKEHIDRQLSLYQRDEKEVFCLMMIDVDHFKNINDTHGHIAGDRILKGLSIKLKAYMRSSDFVARYGGEEFAVIILKADVSQAAVIADKLRSSIELSKFALDNIKLKVTISIGVTQVLKNDTMERLIERADEALYRAKNGGRNKVCIFELESENS